VTSPLLEARKIHKRFPGVHAVNAVDITFHASEVIAVIGENGAGKSTLMQIIAGVHQPDAGEVCVDGEVVTIPSVARATDLGIAFIHQELNLASNLTVSANIYLGREPRKFKPLNFIDSQQITTQTKEILSQLSLDLSPNTLVENLSIGQQQMVEIGKALSQKARLIIMDEPTSSLTQHETNRLFELIRTLKSSGVCIVYISHRLAEVSQIADRVLVLRDGKNSGELAREEITHNRMVSLMVGRELTQYQQRQVQQTHKPMLEVCDLVIPELTTAPINFTVHSGEVVGMFGLVGAGRTELAEAIFGIRETISGTIKVDSKKVDLGTPRQAIEAGVAMVPEDRRIHGLIVESNVCDNITLPSLNCYQWAKFIREKKVERITKQMVEDLNIRITNIFNNVGILSGGNQQKVVLAKWLSLSPQVLLLDEPTRGVDVMSKSEIYQLIEKMVSQEVAILTISSDLEEILRISDRVLVMHQGKLTGELQREELNEDAIMQLATGKQ